MFYWKFNFNSYNLRWWFMLLSCKCWRQWRCLGGHHFGVTPYCDVKPQFHRFLIWTENPLFLRRRPFFSFFVWPSPAFGLKTHFFCGKDLFLVFANFWTEKGCHRKITPRVPPSLATPLAGGLQDLLYVCSNYSKLHDIVFNCKKDC